MNHCIQLCVATDAPIFICNGKYYAQSNFEPILKRYHHYFGPFILCTRVNAAQLDKSYFEISDYLQSVIEIKNYTALMHKKSRQAIYEVIDQSNLIIARLPSVVAYMAADYASLTGKTVISESMGDAWDAYWNHGVAGKIVAPYMYFKMKSVVKKADYAIYVTEKFLQERYPHHGSDLVASNVHIVDLSDEILEKRIKRIHLLDQTNITLMTAAAVNVRFKGQEYVIKAIPRLEEKGIHIKYILAGKGDPSYLRSVAVQYGVSDRVFFTGTLPHHEVLNHLDQTDIYIQPSLQEGLPRAVIEAMSRACPVLGARTAGIPELIPDGCVFERRSIDGIVDSVIRMLNSDMCHSAQQNFAKAKEFSSIIIEARREAYFAKIKSNLCRSDKIK